MRKFLDTSNLVTYQSGKYQGKYDWSNNIGKELYFEYDDTSGYIKIVDYVKAKPQGYVTLQYKDEMVTTTTPNLIHLKIPRLFHKEKSTRQYKYNIGEVITKFNDTFEIIDHIRIHYEKSSNRGYKIKCLDCGYEYETLEQCISTCPICGKKSSYSERFVYSILKQANIKFTPQMEFDWLPIRYYDTYLPDYNAIIEIHGLQHYEPTGLKNRQCKTTEEIYQQTIEADKLKYDTAISNGLNYYIVNASNQEKLFEEAKKVLTFIDFENISKTECLRFANYKDIKQECELWNQGLDAHEIAKTLNKSLSTIQRKLRIGNECGMCIYDKHINMSNARKLQNIKTIKNVTNNTLKSNKTKTIKPKTKKIKEKPQLKSKTTLKKSCKSVRCITTNKIFDSIKEATEYYSIRNKTGISDCVAGRLKSCGKHPMTQEPLKWEYYNGDKAS